MFSMPTISIVLLIVLIIFGAGKLPEIGSALGKGIKDFKKAVDDEPSETRGEKPQELESRAVIDDPSKTPRG